ncbi:PaaI family thioesterase [[Mycobacterium] zoologicum]|uniref:PaaI family thioesterase n=1 Tax=[Mycobacterium] zoologicum TaxID=2872311 RepID=UPI001CDA9581|nr:PaaI family thioesterase [Mycolicibacter sp. MYC101]MEB3062031.1 PaaI family thioesterase [Mycolicibacter sp. MYC101]
MTAPQSIRELFAQLGLQEVASAAGTLTMEMPVDERVVNTAGGLQGGLIATMADVAAGQLAARSTAFGNGIATTDLFIRYLRPITVGPARAVASILRTGRRSVVAQVDIYRGNDDQLAATATVNFAAIELPGG